MPRILSVKEAAMERLNECSARAADLFLPSVRTVYQAEDSHRERPEAIGSSFLLDVDGRKFIVTAAHVFDYSGDSALYVAGDKALVKLTGEFHVTAAPKGNRLADKYDFAFQELSASTVDELGPLKYIDSRQVSENRGTMSGRMFMAMGYPASRNKPNKIDPARAHVRGRAWTFCSTVYTDGVAAKSIGVNDDSHLLLKHNRKFSRTFSGELTRSVKPQGASGGVLVDLGLPHPSTLSPDAECTGLLAGVLIEKHKNCNAIVAVKIGVVLQSIRNSISTQVESQA